MQGCIRGWQCSGSVGSSSSSTQQQRPKRLPSRVRAPAQRPCCSSRWTSSSRQRLVCSSSSSSGSGSVTVFFRDEDVLTQAAPGDNLTEVAAACGVTIPTGCWQGNCGVCEVEVFKFTGDAAQDAGAASSPAVVRACVTKLPPGYARVEVAAMADAIWGLDGFDT